jgi:hypothetical protein
MTAYSALQRANDRQAPQTPLGTPTNSLNRSSISATGEKADRDPDAGKDPRPASQWCRMAFFPSLRKAWGAVGVTTMKWKVYTRDENPSPPVEGFESRQHDSKDDALEAAWQMMYGPTGNRHLKILYIEEPDGNRIEAERFTRGSSAEMIGPHGAGLRRPLVSPAFAGCHVPVVRFKRIGPPGYVGRREPCATSWCSISGPSYFDDGPFHFHLSGDIAERPAFVGGRSRRARQRI